MKILLLNYLISAAWLTLMMYVISCGGYQQTHPKISLDTASNSGNTASTSNPTPDSNNGASSTTTASSTAGGSHASGGASVNSQGGTSDPGSNAVIPTLAQKYGISLNGAAAAPAASVANSSNAFKRLDSQSGAYFLIMQADGNLVEYHYQTQVWSSNSAGKGVAPFSAVMQTDGNLLVKDSSGATTWSTGTAGQGKAPYELTVQNDSNLVLYDATATVIWSNQLTQPTGDLPLLPAGAAISSSGNFTGLASPNGSFSLILQADGNLIEYQGSTAIWSTQTSKVGTAPFTATIQSDGNFVVKDSTGKATWTSGTVYSPTNYGSSKNGPFSVSITNYGNVKIYDANFRVTWSAIGTPGTTITGPTWSPPVPSLIVNQQANLCLDTAGSANGKPSILYNCAGADVNQAWIFSRDHEIQVGADLSRCLTYETPASAVAFVDTAPCNDATNQRWTATAADNSYGQIKPLQDPTMCIVAQGAGTTTNNTPIIVAACRGSTAENWSRKPTGNAIYNPSLPLWPNSSYTDPATQKKQRAAWAQVVADLATAFKNGASSFTIPAGTYRANSPLTIVGKTNFTLYAPGVEIIWEDGGWMDWNNNTNFNFYGPVILDADPQTWVDGVITYSDPTTGEIDFKTTPGTPALETSPAVNSWFRVRLYDQSGVVLADGENPIFTQFGGNTSASPATGFNNLGGGVYQFFNGPWDPAHIPAHGVVGTYVSVNTYGVGGFGGTQDHGVTYHHAKVYAGYCCGVWGERGDMVYHDFQLMRRPGTNRLAGPYAFFPGGTTRGGVAFDEMEVAYSTDDLTDINGPLISVMNTGLPANQFLSNSGFVVGDTVSFLDPTSLLVYAGPVNIIKVVTNPDWSQNVTIDQNVNIIDGSFLNSPNINQQFVTVVDSYFHDGNNQAIQFNGNNVMTVTNNNTRWISEASVAFWLGEGGVTAKAIINNNKFNESSYYGGSYVWPAVVTWNGSPGAYGSITLNNDIILNSPIDFSINLWTTTSINNEVFTPRANNWNPPWEE